MKYLFIVFISYFVNSLVAQNIFFKPDESGMGMAFQIGSNDGTILLGLNGNYTHKGRLTGGLSIGYESNDDQGISSISLHPHIDYLIAKQGVNDMPVSVNLYTYYQYNTFDIDNYTGPALTSNSIGFGMGLFYEIEASSKVSIIPALGIGYTHTTIHLDNISESDNRVGFSISPYVKFNKFYITPRLSFSEGKSAFDVQFGIIFPK